MLDVPSIAPSMVTMQDVLHQPAVTASSRIALIASGEEWSYGRLYQRALQYAGAFRAMELDAGSRIGLLMENGAEYVASYFGTFMAGMIAVPMDPKATVSFLTSVVDDSEALVLVKTDAQSVKAKEVIASQSSVRWLLSASENRTGVEGIRHMAVNDAKPLAASISCCPSAPAVINFTSGSTGRPKGVVMSHGAILANTRSIVSYLELSECDRMMQILPLSYCFGASLLHTHFMMGGSVVLDNRFMYPGSVMANMRRTCCTGFAGIPNTYHTLVTKTDIRHERYPDLRFCLQAGGRMDPALVDTVRAAIAPAKLYVMYGQTEASARLTYLDPAKWAEKRGSVGVPIPGVRIKVATENGDELPPGTLGEIWARGENLMSGYWKQPEETSRTLVDGWLRTGDLGRMDGEGFLFIEGRARNIIKSHGFRISPFEIEDALRTHPSVNEAVALGLTDSAAGEMVAAVLSLRPGSEATEIEIIRHCKRILAPHKVPQRVMILPELPKSASGKHTRDALVELFARDPSSATIQPARS